MGNIFVWNVTTQTFYPSFDFLPINIFMDIMLLHLHGVENLKSNVTAFLGNIRLNDEILLPHTRKVVGHKK